MTTQRRTEKIRACEIVNQDPDIREIEREFDALADEITDPWEPGDRWPRQAPRETNKPPEARRSLSPSRAKLTPVAVAFPVPIPSPGPEIPHAVQVVGQDIAIARR